ncbi:MAG: toxin-antitoxin system protein [Oscillospiraceae bacterium]|nr:toxin-antitoxin system protein [Oscillospiraceae bacterium]MBQ2741870.1 toxin-antitoxin system protein [Oscillospiraceae bacterium]MBQ6698067.1 toxin-antitoxin system protein [Oscillospiraceae bacterium]
MKPLKQKISITIDGDLLEKLKVAAEEDERSLSQYINLVLKKFIESEDEK